MVTDTQQVGSTPQFTVKCDLPVNESFGTYLRFFYLMLNPFLMLNFGMVLCDCMVGGDHIYLIFNICLICVFNIYIQYLNNMLFKGYLDIARVPLLRNVVHNLIFACV